LKTNDAAVAALAVALCFSQTAHALDLKLTAKLLEREKSTAAEASKESASPDAQPEEKPAAVPGIRTGTVFVLIGAGLAALGMAGGGSSGGGGAGGSSGNSGADGSAGTEGTGSGGPPVPRSLIYTSPADFLTPEYRAQRGLEIVKAANLYYNGHYRWYTQSGDSGGSPSGPSAGSGVGVKVAVADTGINAAEASTGSLLSIDAASSYDYVNRNAGSAGDDNGHGTHVAGIVAAPKNGSGMHGLAYNASLVNFKVGDASARITASDAQLADMMSRAYGAGAMIINNSWGSESAITAISAEELQGWMPLMIGASQTFVSRGGVILFAAGNSAAAQPSPQAGLPYRIQAIQPGWLAVVAVDMTGSVAEYSNRCGVAAAWCLAAPGGGDVASGGGLYSMYNDGGYNWMYGTSMAAPHVAGAMAALKSMFPNLGYQQIRDRLLFTANRTGSYADASIYGQGLMDLDAASSPVGGLALPTGHSANGTTAPIAGTGIEFRPGTLRKIGMQSYVLVVDNYQRAPFWVQSSHFFREATPRLIERQLGSLRNPVHAPARPREGVAFSRATGLYDAVTADFDGYRLGFSMGAGGETALVRQLRFAWLPQLSAPGVESLGLGYAISLAGTRIGFLATLPTAESTTEQSLESSGFGSRRAMSIIAQREADEMAYGLSFGVASQFERPLAIAASGAFGVSGASAVSSGAFVQHPLGREALLKASLEVTRYRPQSDGQLSTSPYSIHTASVMASTALGAKTRASVTLRHDWGRNEAATLFVPLTINENGDIGKAAYGLPYEDLVGRTSLSLRLDQALSKRINLRTSLTRERSGFGASATGVAALLEFVH
jgi:subtilisin family serine protease